ncbi:MAG: hypothetical protein M1833_005889 [Piccolia ochrophora]|nr:MAG: hypothetical protein M1833_005889 [Piccolia ochrophora]
MSSLTDRIDFSDDDGDSYKDPEDILSESLPILDPDYIHNSHGAPGSTITYRSPRFGPISLHLPNPQVERERQLFSHHVWNAAIQLAVFIEDGGEWGVDKERVVELGAGTGLCGIVAALSGAQEVVISDYPALGIIGAMNTNVQHNGSLFTAKVSVQPHEWGSVDCPFVSTHGHQFSRVLAADCIWIPGEHQNLAVSMRSLLDDKDPRAEVWVAAGFHTGRANIAAFFDVAYQEGLRTDRIWERNADGVERAWVAERKDESAPDAKRWLVIAVLKLREE